MLNCPALVVQLLSGVFLHFSLLTKASLMIQLLDPESSRILIRFSLFFLNLPSLVLISPNVIVDRLGLSLVAALVRCCCLSADNTYVSNCSLPTFNLSRTHCDGQSCESAESLSLSKGVASFSESLGDGVSML